MSLKGTLILIFVIALLGCAVLYGTRSFGESKDELNRWVRALAISEGQLLDYLEDAAGTRDRDQLNNILSGRSPGWYAFYNKDNKAPEFDDLLRGYEGEERTRNQNARKALISIAARMQAVRCAYELDDGVSDVDAYSILFKEISREEYAFMERYAQRNPDSPFLMDDDVVAWRLITRFLSKMEAAARLDANLDRAFTGVRFDQALMVVEYMRHDPVFEALLVNLPTHRALGDLFQTLQEKLPRMDL